MQAARGASLTNSGAAPAHRPRLRPLAIFAIVTLTAYAVDLGSKILAVDRLTGESPVKVLGTFLELQLTRNPGAAFSTGTSYTVVLSLIATGAVITVLWVARRLASPLWAVGLGFLLGGVLGNLTDRVFREPGFLRGHVVDFVKLPHWPVFNVADACINLAALVIVVQALRGVPLAGKRDPAAVVGTNPGSAPARSDDR